MRIKFDHVVNATLAVCCIAVTGMSVRQQFFRPKPPPPTRPERYAASRPLPANAQLGQAGMHIGSSAARLTLIEFADFECPFCAVAAGELKEVGEKYPGAIAIRFRHMPVPGHAAAWPAAIAAECVSEQMSVEQYYYTVYANYDALSPRKLRALAKEIGIPDLREFDRCVKSERYAARIHEDTAAARRVGDVVTPTWVIGDSVYGGVPSLEQMEEWIQRALAGTSDNPVETVEKPVPTDNPRKRGTG